MGLVRQSALERYFGERHVRGEEQVSRPTNSSKSDECVGALAPGNPEGAREMTGAQPRRVGQLLQRYLLREILVDKSESASDLPGREEADVRFSMPLGADGSRALPSQEAYSLLHAGLCPTGVTPEHFPGFLDEACGPQQRFLGAGRVGAERRSARTCWSDCMGLAGMRASGLSLSMHVGPLRCRCLQNLQNEMCHASGRPNRQQCRLDRNAASFQLRLNPGQPGHSFSVRPRLSARAAAT